jgi:SulP family sulfate permease
MDATGLHALEQVRTRLAGHGAHLLLSGVRAQPMMTLVRSGALERLGEENVCGSFLEASVRAWEVHDQVNDHA